jgi:hypothetical protein
MSARTTRAAAAARTHDSAAADASWRLLALPLRVAALSWGLSTLPLTVLLRLGGRVTRLLDTCLAVVGLTRQTRAARAALATEEALRSQLRQSVARHRVRACARRKYGNARAQRVPACAQRVPARTAHSAPQTACCPVAHCAACPLRRRRKSSWRAAKLVALSQSGS